ncbi:MAG: hypothetical protein KF760_23430 [Candidatus Eremiobacteraeota bacterium]|nr:hypothetical protein [Candidatus Eremiobacteraeota bacterium]MCW5866177.1 hypothetical protein [Candidatus Eremiobacteraeota bacterium]
MSNFPSLAHEITRCRQLLQLSQPRLAQLMNLKTHRLSDLEKARSIPSDAEATRIRRQLTQILHEASWMVRPSSPALALDPRLRPLRGQGIAC